MDDGRVIAPDPVRHPASRLEQVGPGSAKRETRLTSHAGLGVNAAADHRGLCRRPRRIHGSRRNKIASQPGRRTTPQGGKAKKTIAQPTATAAAPRKRAAKRKNKTKTWSLTTRAFIHDVSPSTRCRAPRPFPRLARSPLICPRQATSSITPQGSRRMREIRPSGSVRGYGESRIPTTTYPADAGGGVLFRMIGRPGGF